MPPKKSAKSTKSASTKRKSTNSKVTKKSERAASKSNEIVQGTRTRRAVHRIPSNDSNISDFNASDSNIVCTNAQSKSTSNKRQTPNKRQKGNNRTTPPDYDSSIDSSFTASTRQEPTPKSASEKRPLSIDSSFIDDAEKDPDFDSGPRAKNSRESRTADLNNSTIHDVSIVSHTEQSAPKKNPIKPPKVTKPSGKRKPRKKTPEEEKTLQKLMQKFHRDTETKKGECMVENCRSNQISWRPFNLKRHLKQMHAKEFEQLFADEVDAEKAAEIELFNVVKDAVEMVTINGVPFNILSSSGMRGFIEARLKNLRTNGYKISINRSNIIEEIEKDSQYIENQIKLEMAGKYICLMVDVSTETTLSVLGVNAAYMVNWNVVCRSIGIIQINVRHNAINLAEMMYDILAKYEVPLDRVFAIISDNAKNVVNSATVLDLVANSRVTSTDRGNDDEDDSDDMDELHDVDESIGEENGEELRNILRSAGLMLNGAVGDLLRTNKDIVSINHVNCGTHTLQLGVNDGISDSDIGPIFEEAKEICTTMRTQVVMIEYRKIVGKKTIPPLDNATRWNSRYIMVCVITIF